jgi:hypothetical protein
MRNGSKSAFCAHETQYLETKRQNLSNCSSSSSSSSSSAEKGNIK